MHAQIQQSLGNARLVSREPARGRASALVLRYARAQPSAEEREHLTWLRVPTGGVFRVEDLTVDLDVEHAFASCQDDELIDDVLVVME